jgi:hypothetical protein
VAFGHFLSELNPETFERMGIRAAYLRLAAITGEVPIEDAATLRSQGWSWRLTKEPDRQHIIDSARYFVIANWIRLIFYLPVIGTFAWLGQWFGFFLAVLLVIWHIACITVERYKLSLLRLVPKPAPKPQRKPEHPFLSVQGKLGERYFRPKRFESPALYQAIGGEVIRKIVLEYTQRTKLTPERRARGEKADFLAERSGKAILEFEYGTRVGEKLHLLALAFNIPILILAWLSNQIWFAAYVSFMVLLDGYLVLLQRYHRTRVWNAVVRLREKLVPGYNAQQNSVSRSGVR